MPKVELTVNAKGNADKKVKSLTSSFLTASLALEGIKIATKAVIDISKKSIELFKEQEKQEAQLEQVIKSTGAAAGVTADEMKALASSFQDVTKFGDEAIIGAQNMLLTFTKIGGEVIPAATETILNMAEALGTDLKGQSIQVGKALNDPIVGVSALADVGVTFTQSQKDVIKVLVETGDLMGAQTVILDELAVEYGGAARAAADTFGGALQQLDNVQGDVLESIGRVVSIFGKDFVKASTQAATAVNNFLTDEERLAQIGASFEVIKTVIGDFGKSMMDAGKTAFGPIIEAFQNMESEGDGLKTTMQVLGGVVQGVSSGVAVLAKFVKTFIQANVDMIQSALTAIEVLSDFWKAATGKQTFKEAFDNVSKLGDSFKDLGKNLVTNVKDIIGTTISEFETFTADAEKQSQNLVKVWEKSNKELRDQFKSTTEDIKKELNTVGGLLEPELVRPFVEATQELIDNWEETFEKMNPVEKFDEITGKTEEFAGVFTGIIQDALTVIEEAVNQSFDNQLSKIDSSLKDEVDKISAATKQKLKMAGVEQLTKEQLLNKEIAGLRKGLAKASTIEEKNRIKEQIAEKTNDKKRLQILNDANDKKDAAEEKAAKKEKALKKKQFESNKAFAIANIWINAATAVLGWWAAFASMGIPGIVLAAVATAATLVVAGVQTGIVASQSFADGGVVQGSTFTGDKIQANLNAGEAVLKQDDFGTLVSWIRSDKSGQGGLQVFVDKIVTDSPSDFIEQLNEIERLEVNR